MSTYVVPRLRIFQELSKLSSDATALQKACIIGPKYLASNYPENRSAGAAGTYNGAEIGLGWLNRPAGAVVDTSGFTKLFAENARLLLWSGDSGLTMPATGDANIIKSSSTVFKTNTVADRSAAFYSRDVTPGDYVEVSGTGTDATEYSVSSRVSKVVANTTASATGEITADASNHAAGTLSATVTQTAGAASGIEATASAANYDGTETGDLAETYTVTVIQAGSASTARLRVQSASGRDNVSSIIPGAFASPTAIGTRGAALTFALTGTASSSAGDDDYVEDEFNLGQVWTLAVTQEYTLPTVTKSGTYAGTRDATYVVKVLKGGNLLSNVSAERPVISYTTTTGVDVGGPYTVYDAVPVALGSSGVSVSFDGLTLAAGDQWIFTATAAGAGSFQNLALTDSLPAALRGQSLSVSIYAVGTYSIPAVNAATGNRNYTESLTEVVLAAGIELPLAGLVADNTQIYLTLSYGEIFQGYRALDVSTSSTVQEYSVASGADASDPFMYAIDKALANSNGVPVLGISTRGNDVESYAYALEQAMFRRDAYSIVPLSQDIAVQNAVVAHVKTMSGSEQNRWRICWLNSAASDLKTVYDCADSSVSYVGNADEPVLGTMTDDTGTTGTQYTRLSCTGGKFLTTGVLAGDIVHINYATDILGNESYDSFTVDRVVSEDTLLCMSGPTSAITVASRFVIVRNLTRAGVAEVYAGRSSALRERRVRHVWPDVVSADGAVVAGFFLCAALGGQRSGSAPHRPLTMAELAGFDSVPRSVEFMSEPDLNAMAAAGTWVVTEDPESGTIITRDALTTASYSDQNASEDSITTNFDSVSAQLQNVLAPYIGPMNNTTAGRLLLRNKLQAKLDTLIATSVSEELGPQLLNAEIVSLDASATSVNKIVAQISGEFPHGVKNIDLYFNA